MNRRTVEHRRRPRAPVVRMLALGLALWAGTAAAADPSARAQLSYLHHCVGCHGMDGGGAPDKGVPSMRGTLGRFLQVPGGREFIVQVPGVMNTPLSDRDVATLMNWLLPKVSGDTLPPGLRPYDGEEIARLRTSRPSDVGAARQRLIDAGRAAGIAIEP
jgi:mono/diheme cytochrome c family protein